MIDIETQLRSYQKAENICRETRDMCGRAADEIERLRRLEHTVKIRVLPPKSGFNTTPEQALAIYERLVETLY